MDKFFEKIEALQQKPVHVRQRILYITTGILCALVFLFWLSIFPSTISRVEGRLAGTASSVSPFASLMAPLREAGKSLSSIGETMKTETLYIKEHASTTPIGTTTPSAEEVFVSTTTATTSSNGASE
jgi:hypothetical protein